MKKDDHERVKRKRWERSIRPSVVFGTGVLHISAYSPSSTQAMLLSGAVAETLVEKGWEYVGGDVNIKLVNAPVVTRFPVRPNILLNTLLGFLVGALFMMVVIMRQEN